MIELYGQIAPVRLYGQLNKVPSEGAGGPLQAKTVWPSHSQQIIAPDEDYYGLVSVKVEPVPRLPACVVSVAEDIAKVVESSVVNISAVVSLETVKSLSDFEWEVVPVDGAQYGFALNSAGYYESQNKGVDNSYAMCKIVFRTDEAGYIILNCINYAEDNYDYGLISSVDSMLAMNNSADTGATSFRGKSSPEVQAFPVILPVGEHFLCVKFRKDTSTGKNNDSLQFMIAE